MSSLSEEFDLGLVYKKLVDLQQDIVLLTHLILEGRNKSPAINESWQQLGDDLIGINEGRDPPKELKKDKEEDKPILFDWHTDKEPKEEYKMDMDKYKDLLESEYGYNKKLQNTSPFGRSVSCGDTNTEDFSHSFQNKELHRQGGDEKRNIPYGDRRTEPQTIDINKYKKIGEDRRRYVQCPHCNGKLTD